MMEEAQFNVLLPAITATVSEMIADRQGISAEEAFERLVYSRTYALLEDEDSKLWHLSPLTIVAIFESEENGRMELPDVIRWMRFSVSKHIC